MADADNRPRSMLWRRVIADTLARLGFENARPRPERSLREAIQEGPRPDVEGMPEGVYISVHSDLSPRWGTSVDVAEQAAHLRGEDIAAVIQYRQRVEPERAFVVMSVEHFARLLGRAYYPGSLSVLEHDLGQVLDLAPDAPEEDG